MATNWKSEYNDLCAEIEILSLRAKDLEYQLRMAWRTCFSGHVPSDPGTPVHLPLDKALNNYDNVKEKLLGVIEVLEAKKDIKRKIESHMNAFQGLHYRVAYLRDVEKKSLYSIADELGYTYQYIRRISAQASRLDKNNATMMQQIS